MEFCSLERVREVLKLPAGERTSYCLELADHGNQTVAAAVGAVADPSQVARGSPLWKMLASCAADHAVALHYTYQGWPERARPLRQGADARLQALVARARADLPESQGIAVARGDWGGGHTVWDPAGNVVLGLG